MSGPLHTPHSKRCSHAQSACRIHAACSHGPCRPLQPRKHRVRTADLRAASASTSSTAEVTMKTASTSQTSPATTDSIRGRLAGDQLQKWESCVQQLHDLGIQDASNADLLLSKAFGWTSQAFWRQEKVEEVPEPDQVQQVSAYLNDLGITGANLVKFIKQFPEVLACSLEQQLKPNVQRLETEFRMKDSVLQRALIRRPNVLGYNRDCEGDCIGECNRCWARL